MERGVAETSDRASGARILTNLLYLTEDRGERYGVASLCIGGGEAISMLVERM
jgi:acetyl-CoA C-acetyltransferase